MEQAGPTEGAPRGSGGGRVQVDQAGAGRRSVLPATTRRRRPRGAGHVNPPPLPAFVSPGRVGAGPREAQVLAGGEHWELVPVAMAEGTGGVTWGG